MSETTTPAAPAAEAAPAAPAADAAPPNTLLAAAMDPAPAAPAEQTQNVEAEKQPAPAVPEAYEFKLPEGVALDQATLDAATPVFKDLGLSQEQAQKLVDFQASREAARAQEQVKAWNDMVSAWEGEVKADKEIGGAKLEENVASAKIALDTFGTPALRDALNKFGWGSHPEMVKFMVKVGSAMKEGGSITGAQSQAARPDPATSLFPKSSGKV